MYYSLAQPNHLPRTSTHNFSRQCTSPVGEIYGPRSYTCFTEVFHIWFKKFFLASPRAVMATNGGKKIGRNVVPHHFPACRPPWSVSAKTRLLHTFGTSRHDRSLSILVVTAIVVIASIFRLRCCRQRCDIVVVSNLFSSTSWRATFSKLVSTHQPSRGTMRIAAFSWPSPTFRSPGIRKPVHSFRSALQLSHNLRFKVDLVCNPAPSLPSTLALSILLLGLFIL